MRPIGNSMTSRLRGRLRICGSFLNIGGRFAALKGGEIEQELIESEKAVREMGGKIAGVRQFSLPDGSARTIVVIEKISQTLTKYPRPHAKIAKFPLI